MADRSFEAGLDSLELEESELYNGLETSVASSQLTDFLVQHGVLSPSRAGKEGVDAPPSPPSSPLQAQAPTHSLPSSPQRTQPASFPGVIAHTPEKRHSTRPLQGADGSSHEENFRSQGHKQDILNQTPRSGISSLGLTSPPRHPYQLIHQGTGGEALPAPRRSWDTPAAPGGPGSLIPPSPFPPSTFSSWEAVNRLLRQEGYRSVSGRDEPGEVLGVLRQLIRDRREMGELLKTYQLERQRQDSEQRLVEGRLEGVERSKGDLREMLQAAEQRARVLAGDVERAKKEGAEQLRESKAKCAHLLAKLRQSEHRVKTREAHIDKINSKLEALIAREAKEREQQKEVLRRLNPGKLAPKDGKVAEIIGALEAARQRASGEARALKAEMSFLNDMLKEKENYIARRECSGAWTTLPEGKNMILPSQKTGASAAYRMHCNRREESPDKGGIGSGMQHLLEQVQGLERALRHADKREQSLKQKVSDLEEAKAGLQTTGMRTEAEIDSLKKDLKNRPTLTEWNATQKQRKDLEARLKNALQELRESQSKAPLSTVACASNGGSKQHKAQQEKALSEICRLLQVQELAQVVPAVARMGEAMAAIPLLETFVKNVCGFLARSTLPNGQHLSPEEALRRMPMADAMDALRDWAKEMQDIRQLQRLRSRLGTILCNRDGKGTFPRKDDAGGVEDRKESMPDDETLLGEVAALIALEHDVSASRHGKEQVEGYLAARPDILVNRVVQHFQQLFQVKSLEGLFPKMNELYLFTSEMAVFTRVLKSMLRLAPTCPNNTLLIALQKVIRQARGKRTKGARTQPRVSRASVLEGVPEEGESEDDQEEDVEGKGVESGVFFDRSVGRQEVVEDEVRSGNREGKEDGDSVNDASPLSDGLSNADGYIYSHVMNPSGDDLGQSKSDAEREEEMSVFSRATSVISESTASVSSSTSAASSTRPGDQFDVSSFDKSSIVDFRLLGVLSAAESRSRDSPLPPPRGPPDAPSQRSSNVLTSSFASSTSWTRPLPGKIHSRSTGGSTAMSERISHGLSSSAASGLLNVLSFAESGNVAAFPTPAKAEIVVEARNSRSSTSSM